MEGSVRGHGWGVGCGVGVYALGFMGLGLGFGVEGLGVRVQGLGVEGVRSWVWCSGVGVQGYLAHKKAPAHKTLPWGYAQGLMVVPG